MVVTTLAEWPQAGEPHVFHEFQFLPYIELSIGRIKFFQNLKSKLVGAKLLPVLLQRAVGMNPVLQLESVAIDEAGQVFTTGEKNLIAECVSNLKHADGYRPPFVFLLEFFLVLFHEFCLHKKISHRFTRMTQIRKDNVQ